jgi:hypothetical protein
MRYDAHAADTMLSYLFHWRSFRENGLAFHIYFGVTGVWFFGSFLKVLRGVFFPHYIWAHLIQYQIFFLLVNPFSQAYSSVQRRGMVEVCSILFAISRIESVI